MASEGFFLPPLARKSASRFSRFGMSAYVTRLRQGSGVRGSASRALYSSARALRSSYFCERMLANRPALRLSSSRHRSVASSGRASPSAIIGDTQLK